MKKLRFLFLCMFFIKIAFSQARFAKISGHVVVRSMSQLDTALLSGAEIILSLNDSIKIMSLSDNKGYYEVRIQPFKGTVTLQCNVNKETKSINKKISCLLNNRDRRIINLNKTRPTNYTADFEIQQGCCFPRIPGINFKENSLEFETDSLLIPDKPAAMIDGLINILKDNPNVVIQINGYCDVKEKNKSTLSLRRAELLKSLLIEKGIEKERMKTAGFIDRPIISESQIKDAGSAKEGMILRGKNRRIEYKILGFDYGVKPNSKSGTSKENDEDE